MGTDFLDDLGRKISEAAEIVEKKTGEVAGIVKLKNQIYTLEREINREYREIGKKVYEQYLETKEVDESWRSLCETIAQEEILIDQYKGEIEELKEK